MTTGAKAVIHGLRSTVCSLRSAVCGLRSSRSGSALVLVLWIIALMSTLIAAFAFDAHLEARITSFYRKRSKAEYLAKSGIEVATMLMRKSGEVGKSNLTVEEDEKDDRWKDTARRLARGLSIHGLEEALGEGAIVLDIEPEPARRNINALAPGHDVNLPEQQVFWEQAVEQLLEYAGIPQEERPLMVDAFLDWIDKDETPRLQGAETDDYYNQLEPPYRAKNGPLDTVEELMLVRGWGREVLEGGVRGDTNDMDRATVVRGIGGLLTTYGDGKVNINAAGFDVLMTLPEMDEVTAQAIMAEREDPKGAAGGARTRPSGDEEDYTFKGVEDLYARVPELSPLARDLISTDSKIYRVTSTGVVGGVKRTIWCIINHSSGQRKVELWREEE